MTISIQASFIFSKAHSGPRALGLTPWCNWFIISFSGINELTQCACLPVWLKLCYIQVVLWSVMVNISVHSFVHWNLLQARTKGILTKSGTSCMSYLLTVTVPITAKFHCWINYIKSQARYQNGQWKNTVQLGTNLFRYYFSWVNSPFRISWPKKMFVPGNLQPSLLTTATNQKPQLSFQDTNIKYLAVLLSYITERIHK